MPFSWIRSGRLAIGGFPDRPLVWQALETAGINRVFSCCHPSEGEWRPPAHWQCEQVPLPDHRHPDPLEPALLADAIERLARLYEIGSDAQPAGLYLHCWAGQERSPLLAVALLHCSEHLPLLECLAQVRRLHSLAAPITSQLVLLDSLLSHPAGRGAFTQA